MSHFCFANRFICIIIFRLHTYTFSCDICIFLSGLLHLLWKYLSIYFCVTGSSHLSGNKVSCDWKLLRVGEVSPQQATLLVISQSRKLCQLQPPKWVFSFLKMLCWLTPTSVPQPSCWARVSSAPEIVSWYSLQDVLLCLRLTLLFPVQWSWISEISVLIFS